MAETTTSVAQVLFLVEEEKGRYFIRLQQQYVPGVPWLRSGALRLDLNDEVRAEEAQSLADLLNERVHSIVYTGEDPDAAKGVSGAS